jgi:hypothetical protein
MSLAVDLFEQALDGVLALDDVRAMLASTGLSEPRIEAALAEAREARRGTMTAVAVARAAPKLRASERRKRERMLEERKWVWLPSPKGTVPYSGELVDSYMASIREDRRKPAEQTAAPRAPRLEDLVDE